MIDTHTSDARACGKFARGCMRHSGEMFEEAKVASMSGDYMLAKVYLLAMHNARHAAEVLIKGWKDRIGFGSVAMGLVLMFITGWPGA